MGTLGIGQGQSENSRILERDVGGKRLARAPAVFPGACWMFC